MSYIGLYTVSDKLYTVSGKPYTVSGKLKKFDFR